MAYNWHKNGIWTYENLDQGLEDLLYILFDLFYNLKLREDALGLTPKENGVAGIGLQKAYNEFLIEYPTDTEEWKIPYRSEWESTKFKIDDDNEVYIKDLTINHIRWCIMNSTGGISYNSNPNDIPSVLHSLEKSYIGINMNRLRNGCARLYSDLPIYVSKYEDDITDGYIDEDDYLEQNKNPDMIYYHSGFKAKFINKDYIDDFLTTSKLNYTNPNPPSIKQNPIFYNDIILLNNYKTFFDTVDHLIYYIPVATHLHIKDKLNPTRPGGMVYPTIWDKWNYLFHNVTAMNFQTTLNKADEDEKYNTRLNAFNNRTDKNITWNDEDGISVSYWFADQIQPFISGAGYGFKDFREYKINDDILYLDIIQGDLIKSNIKIRFQSRNFTYQNLGLTVNDLYTGEISGVENPLVGATYTQNKLLNLSSENLTTSKNIKIVPDSLTSFPFTNTSNSIPYNFSFRVPTPFQTMPSGVQLFVGNLQVITKIDDNLTNT